MDNTTLNVDVGLRMEAAPKKGMSLSELKDKFHELGNKVLDFGDEKQPVILCADDHPKMVEYEFAPEISPPGWTPYHAAAEMRKAGFDVRGVRGLIITVCERSIK